MSKHVIWMGWLVGCAAALAPAGRAAEQPASAAAVALVYVGTYTGAKSKGVYLCRFDTATGKLSEPELVAETVNPTFLAIAPAGKELATSERAWLYAANEVGGGGRHGTVTAYGIDRTTGRLSLLNQQSSRGPGPCHASVDASGKCLLVANYSGGSVAVLPIQANGRLGEATTFIQHTGAGPNKSRQEGPHAHFIQTDPSNRHALVCDLGLDQVKIYDLDTAKGALTPHEPPFAKLEGGAGPRHLAFHPGGHWVYVISEMGSTITAFNYAADTANFEQFQVIKTLPEGFNRPSTTAEIEVHPSGRFLYGSNRGHDSLAVYAIDAASGKLTLVEHQSTQGKQPRNFAIDPSGQWLLAANQSSDTVVVFRIATATGRLLPTGQSVTVGAPVCLKYVPAK